MRKKIIIFILLVSFTFFSSCMQDNKPKNKVESNNEKILSEYKFALDNSLLWIKAIDTWNLSYCLNLKDDDLIKLCKWDFYLYDLLANKNFTVCNNFKENYDFWNIMNSKVTNDLVCKSIVSLIKSNNFSDSNIQNTIKSIQKTNKFEDYETFYTFKTALTWKNYCDNINVLEIKVLCYKYFYKDSFFSHLDVISKNLNNVTKIYNE